MAGLSSSMLRSLRSSINSSQLNSFNSCSNPTRSSNRSLVRSAYAFVNRDYVTKEFKPAENLINTYPKVLNSNCLVVARSLKANSIFPTASIHYCSPSTVPLISLSSTSSYRSFFSSSGGNVDKTRGSEVSGSKVDVGDSGDVGINWVDKVKDTWQSAGDATTSIVEKTKQLSDELIPYGQQFLESYPYLKNVMAPVSYTMIGTILAWVVMPKILRRFHKYSMQTPTALLPGLSRDPIPYEKSILGALEDPVRYLVTFMAFLQIGNIVAPSTIASQYVAQGWRGAVILSLIWFLYRWKTNVLSRALHSQSWSLVDRERILTIDKVTSVGLLTIGLMGLAEACGVAVQSILTVGGIGGVATAFAARDVLGNVLSGVSMQFSKPFSLGDTIKAGSIEGQVVEMGLTRTVLLNAEKFPVLVPNSLFSSQVIVNKSRAEWRALVTKIPVKVDDLDKIPQVSNDIKSMLKANPKVFLDKEAPYCFLSRVDSSCAELTIGYNLRRMSKDELYSTEEDILLQSVRIIKKHGASLGSFWQDITT
ncbi:mechanosensitive ion channel protein 1, mitochondrial [Euphorbia lathyris]|uniref:mechanosensitive ion channel protein 1, mitochondrial n=1 Tax=Euphorbia lathyris TaxID=212925 RepID=UPI0033134D5D